MTNFERIKGMSVEEIAKLIIQYDLDSDYWVPVGVEESFFGYEYEKALKAQIAWLEAEAEE